MQGQDIEGGCVALAISEPKTGIAPDEMAPKHVDTATRVHFQLIDSLDPGLSSLLSTLARCAFNTVNILYINNLINGLLTWRIILNITKNSERNLTNLYW